MVANSRKETGPLCAEIIKKIKNGSLQPGDKLLSIREFAQEKGVSRSTAQVTYDLLKRYKYVKVKGYKHIIANWKQENVNIPIANEELLSSGSEKLKLLIFSRSNITSINYQLIFDEMIKTHVTQKSLSEQCACSLVRLSNIKNGITKGDREVLFVKFAAKYGCHPLDLVSLSVVDPDVEVKEGYLGQLNLKLPIATKINAIRFADDVQIEYLFAEKRRVLGFSVEELADEFGITTATVYNYEMGGKRNLPILRNVVELMDICMALNMRFDELFT